MENVIQAGRKFIPIEEIVFVEPFDAATSPDLKSDKQFLSRITLLNRETVLCEDDLESLTTTHNFRLLAEDQIAWNPMIRLSVETFEPTDAFRPSQPYLSRLVWQDSRGDKQSRLCLTPPDIVIATVVRSVGKLRRRRPLRSAGRSGARGPQAAQN